jgi:hypothetical protein
MMLVLKRLTQGARNGLQTVRCNMQLLTYLTLTGLKLGLPINFGMPLIKNGINRLVNGL